MSQTTVDDLQQPPLTAAQEREAVAAIVPATAAGMPPTAQTFFAVVRSDGSLARGFQAVSAARLAPGRYQVLFAHDLTGSAYTGTLGLDVNSGVSPSGQIAVVGRAGAPNGVFVETFDATGSFADRGFHLAVHS